MSVERRFTPGGKVGVERRAEKEIVLTGYASVFYRAQDPGTEYPLWDDLVERIMPGAFDRALREDDVRALFNHDPSIVLGRTTSKTTVLTVDDTGLRYEIALPDTNQARDLAALIERGDITGSSFAFVTERATWVEEENRSIRQIEAVRLYDVGPVTYPAYKATTTGVRSEHDDVRRELEAFRAGRRLEADRVAMRAREVELALRGDR